MELSYKVVGAFFQVYNTLGVGFLESIYSKALDVALRQQGLLVQREVPAIVHFQGVEVGYHRADMLVERRLIVEIKATERLSDIAKRQVRSYLNAFDLELGLVLHFGPRADVHRVLRKKPSASTSANEPKGATAVTNSVNSGNSDGEVSARK